jgi:ankyrin repeat protein
MQTIIQRGKARSIDFTPHDPTLPTVVPSVSGGTHALAIAILAAGGINISTKRSRCKAIGKGDLAPGIVFGHREAPSGAATTAAAPAVGSGLPLAALPTTKTVRKSAGSPLASSGCAVTTPATTDRTQPERAQLGSPSRMDGLSYGQRPADPPTDGSRAAPGDACQDRALEQARKQLEKLTLMHEALKATGGSEMPLCNYVELGDKQNVDLLLHADRDPDERDDQGRTPLMLAALHGRVGMAQKLLKAGADAHAKDKQTRTAFEYAFHRTPVIDMVQLLADANAALNEPVGDRDNKDPLTCAVEDGSVAVVKLLLERGVDANGSASGSEWYAPTTCPDGLLCENDLMIAVKRNDACIVRLLIEYKASVNRPLISSGDAALHVAMRFADRAIVAALLTARANANAQNHVGDTPLHVAAEFWRSDVIAALLEAGAEPAVEDKRVRAYMDGQSGALATARQGGDDVLIDRLTPLATMRTDANVKGALQKLQGARAGLFDRVGRWGVLVLPVCHASVPDDLKPTGLTRGEAGDRVVIYGLQRKPEYNGTYGDLISFDDDRERWQVRVSGVGKMLGFKQENLCLTSSLRIGPEEERVAAAQVVSNKLLLQSTDGLRCRSKVFRYSDLPKDATHRVGTVLFPDLGLVVVPCEASQALCNAIEMDDMKAFEVLLSEVKSPNDCGDNTGHTPLGCAAMHGRVDMARTLLKKGADANKAAGDMLTPFWYAFDAKTLCFEMVQLLIDSNAFIPSVVGGDDRGGIRRPLRHAVDSGSADVVRLLLALGVNANESAIVPSWCPKGTQWEHDVVRAVKRNDAAVLQLLVDYKASVSCAVLESKDTALHYAMRFAHDANVVKVLLDAKADVNARNGSTDAPLHDAVEFCRIDVIGSLLAAGADFNATGRRSLVPLAIATMNEDNETARMLQLRVDEQAAALEDAKQADDAVTVSALTPLVALQEQHAADAVQMMAQKASEAEDASESVSDTAVEEHSRFMESSCGVHVLKTNADMAAAAGNAGDFDAAGISELLKAGMRVVFNSGQAKSGVATDGLRCRSYIFRCSSPDNRLPPGTFACFGLCAVPAAENDAPLQQVSAATNAHSSSSVAWC